MRRPLVLLLLVLGLLGTGCTRSEPRAGAAPGPSGPLEVSVFFPAKRNGELWLAEELRTVADRQTAALGSLQELLEGPRTATPVALFPPGTRVRSTSVEAGLVTVDWGPEVLAANAGAEGELYGIQAVVWTLTDVPEIAEVRFTVEGKDHGPASNGRMIEDWWGHVGLSGQPFRRDESVRTFDATGR